MTYECARCGKRINWHLRFDDPPDIYCRFCEGGQPYEVCAICERHGIPETRKGPQEDIEVIKCRICQKWFCCQCYVNDADCYESDKHSCKLAENDQDQ